MSYVAEQKRKKSNIDVLSEICVVSFPIAHFLCAGLGWSLAWDVVALIVLGGGLLNLLLRGGKVRIYGPELWLIAFFFCCMLSTFLSPHYSHCIKSLIEQVKNVLYCLVYLVIVVQKKKYLKYSFLSFILASVIVAAITVMNSDINNILNVEMKYIHTLRSGLSHTENVNVTAFNMMVGFIFATIYMYTYIEKSNKKSRVLIRLCQLVILVGLFFTGTRKTLLVSAVIIAFEYIDVKKIWKLFGTITVFLVFMYCLMEVPLFYRLIGVRIESFIMGEYDLSDRNRALLADGAKEVFWKNPIIGIGMNGFMKESAISSYAHNNILEILADFGIFGFVSYYSIYVLMLNKIKGTLFNYRKKTVIIGSIIAYFTMEFTQVSYLLLTGLLFLSIMYIYLSFFSKKAVGYR